MADQVLRYRIELDDADLSNQLEAIRNRINSEVSSFTATSMMQTPLMTQGGEANVFSAPVTPPFFTIPNDVPAQIYQAPPADMANAAYGNMGLMGYPTMGPMYNNYPIVPSANSHLFQNQVPEQSGLFNDMTRQSSIIAQDVQQTVGTSSNRASQDIQTFAANAYTGVQQVMPDMQPGGFMSNALAGFGLGYDQRSPMFLNDYRNIAQTITAEKVGLAGESVAQYGMDAALLGTALLVGGPVGIGIGAVGLAKAALDMSVVESQQELRETAKGIHTIGAMQLGVFGRDNAMEIAESMRDYSRSEKGYLTGTYMADIEEAVIAFTSAGGMNNVRSAEGLKTKIDEVMQNFRQVMHILGTTQEEAASIMGEFERRNLVTPGNFVGFASEMKVRGMYAGMSGAQMMEEGLSTVEQFKGTGFGAQNAFKLGIDAATEVGRLANSLDPYYRQNIVELGGTQAAIQKAIQNTVGYYTNTTSGQNNVLGINAYGPEYLAMDPLEQLNANSNLWAQGSGAYFDAKGKGMGAFSDVSTKTLAMGQIHQLYNYAKMVGLTDADGNISEERFLGFGIDWIHRHGNPNATVEELKLILNTSKLENEKFDKNLRARVYVERMLNHYKADDYTFGDYARYKLSRAVPEEFRSAGEWLEGAYHDTGKFLRRDYKTAMDNVLGQDRIFAEDYTGVDTEVWQNLLRGDFRETLENLSTSDAQTSETVRNATPELAKKYTGLTDTSKNTFSRYQGRNSRDEDENIFKFLQANEIYNEKDNSVTYRKTSKEIANDLNFWDNISVQTRGAKQDLADDLTEKFVAEFNNLSDSKKSLPRDKNASTRELFEAFAKDVGKNIPDTATKRLALLNAFREINKYYIDNDYIAAMSAPKGKITADVSEYRAQVAEESAEYAKYFESLGIEDPKSWNIGKLEREFGTIENFKNYVDEETSMSFIENAAYGTLGVTSGAFAGYALFGGAAKASLVAGSTLIGGIGLALASNPVGWTIAGAIGVGLLAYGTYKLLGGGINSRDNRRKEVIERYAEKRRGAADGKIIETSLSDLNATSFDFLTGDSYVNDGVQFKDSPHLQYNVIADNIAGADYTSGSTADDFLNAAAATLHVDGKGTHVKNWRELPISSAQRMGAAIMNDSRIPENVRKQIKDELVRVELNRGTLFDAGIGLTGVHNVKRREGLAHVRDILYNNSVRSTTRELTDVEKKANRIKMGDSPDALFLEWSSAEATTITDVNPYFDEEAKNYDPFTQKLLKEQSDLISDSLAGKDIDSERLKDFRKQMNAEISRLENTGAHARALQLKLDLTSLDTRGFMQFIDASTTGILSEKIEKSEPIQRRIKEINAEVAVGRMTKQDGENTINALINATAQDLALGSDALSKVSGEAVAAWRKANNAGTNISDTEIAQKLLAEHRAQESMKHGSINHIVTAINEGVNPKNTELRKFVDKLEAENPIQAAIKASLAKIANAVTIDGRMKITTIVNTPSAPVIETGHTFTPPSGTHG